MLGYYDPVNQAKRIKCETTITAGLGDYTCPPSGITVLYNNIGAKKSIVYSQGTTHMFDMPNAHGAAAAKGASPSAPPAILPIVDVPGFSASDAVCNR